MKKVKSLLVVTALLVTTLQATPSTFAEQEGFKDMSMRHWAYDNVLWGQAKNIVKGDNQGRFLPEAKVTEEQFLAMLIRSFGDTPDVAGSTHWSDKYYSLARSLNYPVSQVPGAFINRTQVAELVTSTQGKNYSGQDAIRYMLGKGLAKGKLPGRNDVEAYKGADYLTRAESVTFIRNVLEKVETPKLLPRPVQPSDPSLLPNIPEPPKPATGLEGLTQKVQDALAGTGLVAEYNSDTKHILILDNGDLVTSYGDGRKDGGSQVIVLYKALDSNHKPNSQNIQATVKMMQAVGISVDDKTTDALTEVAKIGTDKSATVKYSDFKVNLLRVGVGRVLITIE